MRYKRRLDNVQKQLSDEQEKNQELTVANQVLQASNADLSSKLDALRNYADQIADLQQRLSTSQSEFNACSANLNIANFQLDRLNAVARDTSNQLNRSTSEVILRERWTVGKERGPDAVDEVKQRVLERRKVGYSGSQLDNFARRTFQLVGGRG